MVNNKNVSLNYILFFIMKLGFIGTGKIASSVITGICTSKISFQKILVSPRNRNIAQKLKKDLEKLILQKLIKRLLINVIGYFWL